MAHRDRPFSDTEKVNLLAEIIKTSSVHPSTLLNVIYEHSIVPQWADVARPPGRSTSECEQVFADLRNTFPPHLGPPVLARPPTASYPPPGPPPPGFHHRPWNAADVAQAPPPISGQGRSLQPRPQGVPPNVYSPSGTGSPYATTPTEPLFKKRGRPTNAEVEMRKAEAEARGETYAPQRSRKRSKAQQSTPQNVKRLSLGGGARPVEEASSAGESKRSSLAARSSRSPPPQASPGASGSPSVGPSREQRDSPPASLEPRQHAPGPAASMSFMTSAERYRGHPPPPPPRHYSPAQPHAPPHSQGIVFPHPSSTARGRTLPVPPPTTTGSSPAPPPR